MKQMQKTEEWKQVYAQAYRLATRMLGNETDAEDVAMDVVLKWLRTGFYGPISVKHSVASLLRKRAADERLTGALKPAAGGGCFEASVLRLVDAGIRVDEAEEVAAHGDLQKVRRKARRAARRAAAG
jgi:DNA-directed RNA polymerase specialized sigma24 family protein